MPANASDQAAERLEHLRTQRGITGSQDHYNRPASVRIVDMDRQKAALIIVGVPSRQWLVTAHGIDRIIDVKTTNSGGLR